MANRTNSKLVAIAALVFGVGVLSAPLRVCAHHASGDPEAGAVAGSHDGGGAHSGAHGGSHEDMQHEPCDCLSQCDTQNARLGIRTGGTGVAHAPPLPEARPSSPERLTPRAPTPRVIPFPNPPPLSA